MNQSGETLALKWLLLSTMCTLYGVIIYLYLYIPSGITIFKLGAFMYVMGISMVLLSTLFVWTLYDTVMPYYNTYHLENL